MRTSRMSRSSIDVPCFAAASSRSVWVNVSPLSSQSLPRWRAMSISTPRPATPRSAIGRIDAQLMPPPLVVSAERPFQSVSSYQAWPSASYCDDPWRKISALSSVARMPPGKLGPLPDSKSSWSHTISRLMPSRPGKTGSPCGWPIGHWSVKTWPSRTLATPRSTWAGSR